MDDELRHGLPFLRKVSVRWDFVDPARDALEFSALLEKKMSDYNGLGLSAVQIGIPVRVFAMRTTPDVTCFNPLIVDSSTQEDELEEGCLSFPGLLIKVSRPKLIKVRFANKNGERVTLKLSGMTARIFQHEMDHLDGKLFFDHVSRLRLDMALKKAAKRGYKYSIADLRSLENA